MVYMCHRNIPTHTKCLSLKVGDNPRHMAGSKFQINFVYLLIRMKLHTKYQVCMF